MEIKSFCKNLVVMFERSRKIDSLLWTIFMKLFTLLAVFLTLPIGSTMTNEHHTKKQTK